MEVSRGKIRNLRWYSELRRHRYDLPAGRGRKPSMWSVAEAQVEAGGLAFRSGRAKRARSDTGELVPVEQAEAAQSKLTLHDTIEGNTYATASLSSPRISVCWRAIRRAHRHSAAALQAGACQASPALYTVVNGERIDMAPGDVVLT